MADDDRIQITICGDGGCGKSSITLRLVRSQFTDDYDPTIEDSYSVTRMVDGKNYYLSLLDTAGQEEYRSLWAHSNLRSDAFLLVYDITQASTLTELEYFTQMIDMECEHREDTGAVQPVKMVAGNKCDLKDARAVTARTGLEWARNKGCGFMETSAREMVNIEETFALIIRRVVAARQQHASQQGTSPTKSRFSRKKASVSDTIPSASGQRNRGQSNTTAATATASLTSPVTNTFSHHTISNPILQNNNNINNNQVLASPSSPHLYQNKTIPSKEESAWEDYGYTDGKKGKKGFWARLKCW